MNSRSIQIHVAMRTRLVYWLYLVGLIHFLAGLALPLFAGGALFSSYHDMTESTFWHEAVPIGVRSLQVWWLSLFGATIQSLSVWMLALIRLGDIHRSRFAWSMLSVGLIIWAPQDMWISYQAGVFLHVWIDLFALVCLLPALLMMLRLDRSQSK